LGGWFGSWRKRSAAARRGGEKEGRDGGEEQNDWLSERGRLVPLIPLPPRSLSLSPRTALSFSLLRARDTSPRARRAREQPPPTDHRRARGLGRSDAGAAVMAAPSAGAGGGGGGAGEGSSSSAAAAAAAATIGAHGVDQGE